MIITLNVSVGTALWGEDIVRKEIELKTENPTPRCLPWRDVCAGLVESALMEWERQEAEGQDAS